MTLSLPPRFYALVPCAGVGARAGTVQPKQYAPVAGRPMVQHTLRALAQVRRLQAVWVLVQPGDTVFATHVPDFTGRLAPVGGPSRAHTVLGGLAALQADGARPHDWVLVHDAARCLLQAGWVDALIDACRDDPVGGLLALPVADTLKQAKAGEGARVAGSVDRADKWQAQTPQMFRLGPLHAALAQALARSPEAVTDEASAMEAVGEAPLLVRGALENFKLTYPSDFELAERILRTRPC